MKKFLIILTIVSSFAFAGVASARHPMGPGQGKGRMGRMMGGKGMGMGMMHHGKGMKGHKGNIFQKIMFLKTLLNLTPDQVTKIMKINIDYKIKRLNYMKVLAPLKIELKKLAMADTLDIKKIQQTLTKISSYKINKKLLRYQEQKAIMDLFTPEQKLKIQWILSMRGGHHKK